ncbi:MAG: DUF5335 domain-containing protein [Pyrinomonadaceae bacterium]|nr:DUF5335 domain-containing protein [Pyrinomonadaceae bacterium]
MTIDIPKEKWIDFFNDLSKRRFGWETKVEILNKEVGDQILVNGLPLNGIIFEEKSGKPQIEISVGENIDQHQTHNLMIPNKVGYLDEGNFLGGVVEIEDEKGTQILIKLLNPMPIYLGYTDYQIVMASSK